MNKPKRLKRSLGLLAGLGCLLATLACSAPGIYRPEHFPVGVRYHFNGVSTEITVDGIEPKAQLIFYPGGRVVPESYNPILSHLAATGLKVHLVTMPFDLAVFDPLKFEQVMAKYPNEKHWYLGGHSLGGAMAVKAIRERPGKFEGLLLLGAYPAKEDSIANQTLKVWSISGSQDGLSTPAEIEAAKPYLPATTTYFEIPGANHSQFASYGSQQAGDLPPNIDAGTQRQEVAKQVIRMLYYTEPVVGGEPPERPADASPAGG